MRVSNRILIIAVAVKILKKDVDTIYCECYIIKSVPS